MTRSPLTRKESQARTRARLLESAARAFARDGLEATSIERLAGDAGYTRGAFYANFKDRKELYLAMLEEAFDRYLERFSRILATDEEPEVRARRAGDDVSAMIEADPEGQRLFFEFAAHALRDEGFRRELVKRYSSLREGIADVFRTRAEEYGVEPPLPLDQLTAMMFAIWIGIALDKLLEPEVISEEMYGALLAIFFAGLRAMAEAPERRSDGER